ncbi:MAG: hypothetical protein ACK5L6_05715 [Anaerorhabdus sp.]|uniref:hypothetical protein n=1 Tax=Anaerorhabdus sp. TaxID=1872524 RepID=UPI003A851E6B
MKKFFKVILSILLIIAITAIGVYVGVTLEYQRNIVLLDVRENISTTIAVVNQDLGVNVSEDKKYNYAESIINQLGNEYTLTSFQLAEKGLEDGNYGAILVFPADFSSKVMEFNSDYPNSINIEYKINEKLVEKKYVETYKVLTDAQKIINDNIEQIYVVSIYNEFHKAQDEVVNVLDNDSKDMKALEQVKLGNYTQLLNFSDIPETKLDLEVLETEPYISNVTKIANDIVTIYDTSYTKAKNDYVTISAEITTSLGNVESYVENYKSSLDTYSTTTVNLVTNWADQVNLYQTALNDYKGKMEVYKTGLDDYASGLTQYQIDLENYYNNGGPGSGSPMPTPSVTMPTLTDPLPTQAPEAGKPTLNPLPTIDVNYTTEKVNLLTKLNSYNPDNYLTQTEKDNVDSKVNEYAGELTTLKTDVDSMQLDNNSELTVAYGQYNKHVVDLRTEAYDQHDLEQTYLKERLDSFYTVKDTTSETNKSLLESFSKRMPNSKNDGVINKNVVEFVVQPIRYFNQEIRSDTSINEAGYLKTKELITWIIIGSISFILITATIYMCAKTFRKKQNQ